MTKYLIKRIYNNNGDDMKKFLLSILLAIMVGSVFGFIIYKRFNKEELTVASILSKQVYAFQIGVFEDKENALTLQEKYGGIIVNDNNRYRVYLALASSSNVLTILKEYYNDLDISYYIKQIDVNDNILELINEAEAMLIATTKDNYDSIINNVLKEYELSLV